MTEATTKERVQTRVVPNPLEKITPALERMGIVDDGEYYFTVRDLNEFCDSLVLERRGRDTTLTLFCIPVSGECDSAGVPYTLVRKQTVIQAQEQLYLVTDNAAECSPGFIHPYHISYTTEVDFLPDEEDEQARYDQLLSYLGVLVDTVRLEDRMDERTFSNRSSDICPDGNGCEAINHNALFE